MFRSVPIVRLERILGEWWIFAIVVGLGWLFRLRAYVFNRSFWLDEAMLANNVIYLSLEDLATKPLMHKQVAPTGFLVVTKLLASWIGDSEIVLRLVPFAAGMGLVLAACWLSFEAFDNSLPRLVFVGLVSFSQILIYYSGEFKQYILDVGFVMLMLAFGLFIYRLQTGTEVRTTPSSRVRLHIALFGAAGAVGIWFSQPLAFFLFAVGVSLFSQAVRQKKKGDLILLIGIGVGWAACFSLSLLLALRNVTANQSLFEIWAAGSAPIPIKNLSDVKWYSDTVLAAVFLAFQERTVVGIVGQPGWYSLANIILTIICALGGWRLVMRNQPLSFMLFLSSTACLLTSALEYYPLRGRLLLFTVPIIFLLVSYSVDAVANQRLRFASYLLSLCLLGSAFLPTIKTFIEPAVVADIRGVMRYMEEKRIPGEERVAVSQWSLPSYLYYAPRLGLNDMKLYTVIGENNDAEKFLQTVCASPDPGRIWLVFSLQMVETQRFLDRLQATTSPLDQLEREGAGVYLFDFSSPGVCQ